MKKLSEATVSDFAAMSYATENLHGFATLDEVAQAFIDIIFEQFQDSMVLLRLFSTIPYSALSDQDRQLVDKKTKDSGTSHLCGDTTPVLTLLATRGQRTEWNQRSKSRRFRCIPLVSSGYVSSLAMMSMQFKAMSFDLSLLDSLANANAGNDHAHEYTGMLYVKHAGKDRDEQGRMIVPHQDFVSENNVKTTLGFGTGYSHHPAIVTLFAFTNEVLNKTRMEPVSSLLKSYLSVSREILNTGRIFSGQARQVVGRCRPGDMKKALIQGE